MSEGEHGTTGSRWSVDHVLDCRVVHRAGSVQIHVSYLPVLIGVLRENKEVAQTAHATVGAGTSENHE